ncbi:MAG: hypothetical protein ACJ8C4_14810 [Gemmataceae bacterium]
MKRLAFALLAMAALSGGFNFVRAGNCAHCPTPGLLNPPAYTWTTPYIPSCQPRFAGGAPIMPLPDGSEPSTIITLAPFYYGPPPDRPPERHITHPVERIRQPGLPDLTPRDTRPDMPPTSSGESLSRLHVLILADAGAKDTGKTHAAGAALFEQLLRSGVRLEKFGRVEKLTSGALDAEAILKKLGEITVLPDDSLVIYYAGAMSYDEAALSYILTPSGSDKKLSRPDLRQAAIDKKARFTLIMTDPAMHTVIAEPPGKPTAPEPGASALESWLLGHRGMIDIHASSVGEFAAARGEYGGCFTVAFVREFGRPAGSWADMVESVKFTTNNLFKSYRLEVLKSDDPTPAQKAIYRNQESQVPITLTPLDSVVPLRTGSSKPTAAPAILVKTSKAAKLEVRLPADAKLWIDGRPTTETGTERKFELPAASGKGDSLCELRMEVNGWFGVYRVTVTPGKTAAVDLQMPSEVVNTSAK